MAPPLPPPGVPALAGLAPRPIALLPRNSLSVTAHETPMLDSAAPLEQRAAGEGAAGDLHGLVAELVEHPDRRAAEVGPGLVAAVAGERRVHHREPAAAHEDRASPAALLERPGGVAAGEGEVPEDQLGVAWSLQCDVVHTSRLSQVFW